jgi:hypothetical protein
MLWSALIPIILQYGVPVAEKIWQLATTNTAPTQADWDALKALSQNTARTQLLAALARANIAVTDPVAVALLAQVSV